ncbi:MAG TPA: sortase [Acidimicrobiales bacterium]|nr:sortase [Acidimicrobiales bacterium]
MARSRWTRFGLPVLVLLLCLVAAAALAFPMLSNWWAGNRQNQLAGQLDDPALAGQVANGTVADGKPIGRIMIPAIGLNMVAVQGVDAAALASGPGHYPGSPMPCTIGNAALAGHRTTFLHPFAALDKVGPGDLVEFSTPAWTCSYVVSAPPFSVLPTDTSVVANTPGEYTLTLTTCTPPGSATHRLVLKAVMVTSSLHAAAKPSAGHPGTHAARSSS